LNVNCQSKQSLKLLTMEYRQRYQRKSLIYYIDIKNQLNKAVPQLTLKILNSVYTLLPSNDCIHRNADL